MKTILFILFAFSCTAQEGMTQSEIKMIESNFDYSDYWDEPNTDNTIPFPDPCIDLSDLMEYERECFNDSTLVYQHFYDSYDRCDGYMYEMHGMSNTKKVPCNDTNHLHISGWRHREPTFTGFIQWLKNRMK